VYNLFAKWRKEHLGVKDGKEMYDGLEERVKQYNQRLSEVGGNAVVQQYCGNSDGSEKPLI